MTMTESKFVQYQRLYYSHKVYLHLVVSYYLVSALFNLEKHLLSIKKNF